MSTDFAEGQGWPDGIDRATPYPPQQPQRSPCGKFFAIAGIPSKHSRTPFTSEGVVHILISSPDLGMAGSEILKAWQTTRDSIPNNLAQLQITSFGPREKLGVSLYLGEQCENKELYAGLRTAESAMGSLCSKLVDAGFISCSHEDLSRS